VKVLCIDPGPHVGLATWEDHAVPHPHEMRKGADGRTIAEYIERHQAWETTPEKWYAEVEPWVMWADVIVCEGFVISGARARDSNITIEMIGVMRYLAAREHKKFVEQRPGAYRFAGADKLKRLGWYTVGSDHARSASGHLVLYLCESGLLDAARLLP
jgi:hypothetical protein